MIRTAVARRYARGLLGAVHDAAQDGQGPAQVAEQLDALAGAMARFGALEHLVRNPAIDADKKAAVIGEVADKLEAGALVHRFIDVLADNERLEHLRDIALAFRTLVDEELGIINAEVTAPQELDDAAQEELRAQLAAATGRQVRLHTRIDPGVLGGLVTRIGDVLYDGSLRHQLARMRSRMMES